MGLHLALVLVATFQLVSAYPFLAARQMDSSPTVVSNPGGCQDQNFVPRLFVPVPMPTDTSAAPRPGPDYPYIAPNATDQRGPCPGLNTLANHGYIPRSGIATTEEVIQGVSEAFNMGHDFATFLASYATLARGNPGNAMLSIGYNDSRISALPGCPDGDLPRGIAQHGRFEGDVSDARTDADIGDAVAYNYTVFSASFPVIEQWGKPSSNGPLAKNNLIDIETLGYVKNASFAMFQATDSGISFHLDRQMAAFFETAFVLELMGGDNNNTHTIALGDLMTFFANQTFPAGFRRREGQAELDVLGGTGGQVRDVAPVPPGGNVNGTYLVDWPSYTDFFCDAYVWLVEQNLPATLNNLPGIPGQNVQTLLENIYKPFRDTYNCPRMVYPLYGVPGA